MTTTDQQEAPRTETLDLSTLKGKVFVAATEPPIVASFSPEAPLTETPDLSTLKGKVFIDVKEPTIGGPFSPEVIRALVGPVKHRGAA